MFADSYLSRDDKVLSTVSEAINLIKRNWLIQISFLWTITSGTHLSDNITQIEMLRAAPLHWVMHQTSRSSIKAMEESRIISTNINKYLVGINFRYLFFQ